MRASPYMNKLRAVVLLAVLAGAAPARADILPFFTTGPGAPSIDRKQWYVSDGWRNGDWQNCQWTAHNVFAASASALELRLDKNGGKISPYGCGEIQYMPKTSYGTYAASLRTAAGSGLNTAFFTYIGPPMGTPQHDEIDFEFMGKAPDTVDITVWTNEDSHGKAARVPLGFDASKAFHTYSFKWTPDAVLFYADDKLIFRTQPGETIPSHPGHLFFSLWSGGKAEDEWMGPFTYTAPATAYVAWAKFTPL